MKETGYPPASSPRLSPSSRDMSSSRASQVEPVVAAGVEVAKPRRAARLRATRSALAGSAGPSMRRRPGRPRYLTAKKMASGRSRGSFHHHLGAIDGTPSRERPAQWRASIR